MSTYKVQPVYAELVFGWLDLTLTDMTEVSLERVSKAVSWNFKGGMLGDYPMRFPTDCSMTRFPTGDLRSLAMEHTSDTYALLQVVKRRRGCGRRTLRSIADWYYSLSITENAVMASYTEKPAITGLRAVYLVFETLVDATDTSHTATEWSAYERYIRETALCSAAASHMDVPTVDMLVAGAMSAVRSTCAPQLCKCLTELAALIRTSESRNMREQVRSRGLMILYGEDPEFLPPTVLYVLSIPFRVMHGCALISIGGQVYILSRSDLVRLHQIVSAVMSGVFATAAQAAIAPGDERLRAAGAAQAYMRQVGRVCEAIRSVPQGEEVVVCKAFKRAFTYFLGKISGPLGEREANDLWAETLETKFVPRELMANWVNECGGWSASTAFNIGKVYKICPAPDACPGRTLLERHEMMCNHNMCETEAVRELGVVLRDQMLRAYIRRPHTKLAWRPAIAKPDWAEAYLAGRFDDVPTSQIHQFLEWEGTATMPARSAADPSVWKDSGLGWDTLEVAMSDEKPRMHGNMLTRMLVDNAAAMPDVRHMRGDHVHKIDTKPEGYKDPARGIYSGNLSDRLDQSWMEIAVQDVARHHPSFMIGASTDIKEARVRALVDKCHTAGMQDIYYSFDIAGWSPRMPGEVQRISHAFWAQLYDEELFRHAHLINEGRTIYMNKAGYTGWFVNPGVNLEGYNGKEMTCVLIALMARAVSKWRDRVVAMELCTLVESRRWSALLLAYIDDGLAKLTLPSDRVEVLFSEFKICTVAAFAECGFTVEVSKCFPSDRFAIFLNEIYLGGRHIAHGTRAAMTICAENTEPHTTLLERVTSVSTGCRGAVTAGLDAMCGSLLQSFHVFRHIREWIRNPNPVAAAIWSFMPRNWGGLGLPTMLQLGTSGGGSAFEESVYTMQRWARISAPAKTAFLSAARTPLRDRTALGMVNSPLGGSLSDGPMIESRIPDAVRAGLVKLRKAGKISSLARTFLEYSSPESMQEFCTRVLSGHDKSAIQEQLLSDLAMTHPHSLFSAFAKRIEKSSTLVSLVGPREMQRMIRAGRKDAVDSYRVLKLRCTI